MIILLTHLLKAITVKGIIRTFIVLMRVLLGIAWLLAGVTKITDTHWFSKPGVFLNEYLTNAITLSHVPGFYKYFIESVVLPNLLLFNYAIPIIQVIVGLLLIVGFLTLPSVLLVLFMHVNFILSGNMNGISLLLYTSAFGVLISGQGAYHLSLDKHLGRCRWNVYGWFHRNQPFARV